ncbi:hypothetical protein [Catenulispora subtropica]|uniref:DNA-binding protein n=1 Tax=Catenulispora subtropica TaxID=450798 RepID=A0ABN2S366_9ACTN
MSNRDLTWWPVENGFQIALDGRELVCRDRERNPVVPVPQAVLDTRSYPAWALVNRPGEADLADASEAVVKGLWGRQAVVVAAGYERAADNLPAEHLPVFFEQAARKLDRSYGDKKRAASFFARARAAEAEHGLPITDQAWLGVHFDFAALGVLSAKSVADFVKALPNRAEPDTALEALIRVAVLRAHAGQAPWPQLPKQVSAFAKAAKRDELAAHRDLVEQLVGAESLGESAVALWTTWEPILVRVCAESPKARGLLLNLLPEPEKLDGWWLEFLDGCGASAGLFGPAEPGAEPAGGRAAWLERTVWHPNMNATLRRRKRSTALLVPQISELIVRMAQALREDGVPVRLHGPDYWAKYVDVNVLETCLAHGVPVADLAPGSGLALESWLRLRGPEDDLAATAADPRFAPILRSWAEKGDAVRLWTIPALRRFLPEPAGTETDRHPLDGPKMHSAVHDFDEVREPWGGHRRVPNTLHTIRVLTRALREGTAPDTVEQARGFGVTMSLAGRVEWAVLRAVSPATHAERRAMLRAFLEVWAESVFTDPGTRIYHGTAHLDRDVAADEHGLALASYHTHRTAEPFVAVTDGATGSEPPSLGPVETVTERSVGWGTAERLRRVLDQLCEHGPVPHDPAAAAALVDRGTGLSRGGAEMVLAGIFGADGRNDRATLSPEAAAVLGIDAKQGGEIAREVSWLTADQRLTVLTGVLPDDPAELWRPGGMVAVAERLARAWTTQLGGGAAVPEQTLSAAPPNLSPDRSIRRILSALAGPDRSPILTRDIDVWLRPGREKDAVAYITSDGETVHEFDRWLSGLTHAIAWAYAALPEGDPVRAGIPEAVRLLRERFAHPGLLLYAIHNDRSVDSLAERFGPVPYSGPVPLPDVTFDDGLIVVAHRAGKSWFYFRPSRYRVDAARTAELDALNTWHLGTLAAVRFLTGPECDRMVERVASGGLAAGAREADPRASAPEIVADLAGHFGLSTDAAALYLQLLAMPHPSDAQVRIWNGWSTAQHKDAVSEILARGLVVEDKRPKSGRKVFLPGTWEKAADYKYARPMEAWKLALLRTMSLHHSFDWPFRPLPELFAAARDRVVGGDVPQ